MIQSSPSSGASFCSELYVLSVASCFTSDLSSELYVLSVTASCFTSDLSLGGVLLFPIDDKESRNEGQDLVSEKNHINLLELNFDSHHLLRKLPLLPLSK